MHFLAKLSLFFQKQWWEILNSPCFFSARCHDLVENQIDKLPDILQELLNNQVLTGFTGLENSLSWLGGGITSLGQLYARSSFADINKKRKKMSSLPFRVTQEWRANCRMWEN